LIAIVIAKPLELKIFESEIETELVQMQQENYKKQDDLVRSRYTIQIDTTKSEILALKSESDTKTIERDRLVYARNPLGCGTLTKALLCFW